jgi:hypothetical protein
MIMMDLDRTATHRVYVFPSARPGETTDWLECVNHEGTCREKQVSMMIRAMVRTRAA